jgi:hypothetical protein
MSDRELLALAAMAAGYKVYDGGKLFWIWKDSNVEWVDWNPLSDDGDALRLAAKLHIGVRTHGPDHWLQKNVAVALWDAGERSGQVTIQADGDFLRSTRRAIVRAAAEIGRHME